MINSAAQFAELWASIRPKVIRMLKTLGIGDESEDLAQVIAFRLWTHKETIQSKEQFEAYAFHAARNKGVIT